MSNDQKKHYFQACVLVIWTLQVFAISLLSLKQNFIPDKKEKKNTKISGFTLSIHKKKHLGHFIYEVFHSNLCTPFK